MRRTKNISLVTVIRVVSFGIVVARFGSQLSLSVGSDLIPLSCSLFARMIDRAKKIARTKISGEGKIRKEGENAPSYLARSKN